MSGNVRVIFKKDNIVTDCIIDIKEANHLCASYPFLYGTSEAREKILALKDDMYPTYGCLFINHDEHFFKSSQQYFDIEEYGINFIDALGYSSLKFKIPENILEMILKGGYTKIDVLNKITYKSNNVFDYETKYVQKDIHHIKDIEEWYTYVKNDIYSVSCKKDTRIIFFDIPKIVPFFQISKEDMNKELEKFNLPLIENY